MAWFDSGNAPINSSAATVVSNPSTTTLLAEIGSTQFPTAGRAQIYRVSWFVGASTLASFALEQALSTSIDSTAIRDRLITYGTANQTAQFIGTYRMEAGDRLRVRVSGSTFTGSAFAKISAEPMT